MNDFLLKLENDQHLRIFPFDKTNLFKEYHFYHIDDLGEFILDTNTNIVFTDRVPRVVRSFYLVEHNGKLSIMKTGMRIRHKINEYFSDDNGQSFYTPEHLLDCIVILEPVITQTMGFNNYDKSKVYQFVTDHMNNNDVNVLFDSPDYKQLMSDFDNYIENKKLENNPKKIKSIADDGLFAKNHEYLLRGIKINQFRKKKVDTTKTKLWNQVIKMVGETSHENERIEDIGYLKEDKSKEEVHQFMVDGYLFEVKLKDEI